MTDDNDSFPIVPQKSSEEHGYNRLLPADDNVRNKKRKAAPIAANTSQCCVCKSTTAKKYVNVSTSPNAAPWHKVIAARVTKQPQLACASLGQVCLGCYAVR